MTDHPTRFAELMDTPFDQRETELLTRFLEDTAEALNARYDSTAVDVAKDFDQCRREAVATYENEFFATVFTVLSDLIKHYRLTDEDSRSPHPATDSTDVPPNDHDETNPEE